MIEPELMIEAFKNMKLGDLNEFIKKFEETFDVKATAPQIVTEVIPGELLVEDEEKLFDLFLTEVGPNKIQVIKAVREILKLGLKEAKDFVESVPQVVLEKADNDAQTQVSKKLLAVGAKTLVRAAR